MSTDKKPIAVAPPTKRQMVFFSWTKDVLIYIIVLNLFVEYNYKIVIELVHHLDFHRHSTEDLARDHLETRAQGVRCFQAIQGCPDIVGLVDPVW